MQIDFEIEPGIQVISDQFLLMLVVENLIDNAIKFHNDSPRVVPFVKIRVLSEEDRIRVVVLDNGIGVNPSDREHIFHLFTRASHRSETGGIGLYLSKLAADRLGGQVVLVNTSPDGSEFHLILPADVTPIIQMRRQQEDNRKKEKEMRDQQYSKESVPETHL